MSVHTDNVLARLDQSFPELYSIVTFQVYIGIPAAVSSGISIWIWWLCRSIPYASLRSCIRAVVLAILFTPTILFVGVSGLHGAMPLPYFAWKSIYDGIVKQDSFALFMGLVPLGVCL